MNGTSTVMIQLDLVNSSNEYIDIDGKLQVKKELTVMNYQPDQLYVFCSMVGMQTKSDYK